MSLNDTPSGERLRISFFGMRNVGKSSLVNEKNDFALTCKIVRADNSFGAEEDFISKISEASNSTNSPTNGCPFFSGSFMVRLASPGSLSYAAVKTVQRPVKESALCVVCLLTSRSVILK